MVLMKRSATAIGIRNDGNPEEEYRHESSVFQGVQAVRGTFVIHPDWLSEATDSTRYTGRRWKPWPWEFQGARTWSYPVPPKQGKSLRQSEPCLTHVNVSDGGRPQTCIQVTDSKPQWRMSLRPKEKALGPYGPRPANQVTNLLYPELRRHHTQYPMISVNSNDLTTHAHRANSGLPRFTNNLQSSYLPTNQEMYTLQRMRSSVANPDWSMHRPVNPYL